MIKVPDPLKPYEAGAELVVAIAVAMAIAWGIFTIKGWHDAAQANGQTVTQQAAQLSTASTLSTDLGTKQQAAQRVEIDVRQSRDDYNAQAQQARAFDPVVDHWSTSPVPARLLELARERRAARDRSAAGSAWSSLDPGEEAGAGTDQAPGPGADQR